MVTLEAYEDVYLIKVDGVYHGGKYVSKEAATAALDMGPDDMLDMWVEHYSTVGNTALSVQDVTDYIGRGAGEG